MSALESVALERELRRTLQGEVRFDDGHRALYATDSSNYRHVPVGVVFPRDDGDVEAAVAACGRFGAPVLTRGAGTSLAGQACNVAVVLDTSRHLRGILDLDPTTRRATVQAGIVLDRLQEAAAAHGLMFGADPSTHACCTLGGMIGNNACGVHSLSAGKTVDNVEELEILTSDGVRLRVGATDAAGLEAALAAGGRREEIYRRLANLRDRLEGEIRNGFPRLPRRVSGYNLDELLPENGFHLARALVGSEGTCAVILSAVLRLVPREPYRTLLVLGYPDVVAAAEQVPAILEHRPEGLEGMDAYLLAGAQMRHAGDFLPPAGAWLMAELGGPEPAAGKERARRLLAALGHGPSAPTSRLCESPEEQQEIWRLREAGVGTTSRMPGVGDTWPGWEDSAVPPERLGPYLQAMQALFGKHGLEAAVYGHFGDGCVHTRLSFRLGNADGVRAFRTFMEEAADLVVAHGGSLSGEHGDGQARGELLSRMYGSSIMEGFREFKSIWDPGGLLNPGKLVDARPLDSDLRLPGASGGAPLKTHFDYATDDHSFARAVLRCVGVGKCRREDGGLMCPSYMATREEEHSTRGRARLLGEMVRGEVVRDGWRDQKVKEALDLCLSCKGCKNDCPAGVDMATYKAEFLSHFHESHGPPLGAYAAGYVAVSARLGMVLPGFVNAVLGSRSVGGLIKRVAGIAPERRLPRLAKQSFRGWFRRRGDPRAGGPRVLLWPDTFTNYYQPRIAVAAVRLLEGAGFQVEIPSRPLCCGRPLFDAGLLETAKRWLTQICGILAGPLAVGVPVVGLEPGCVSVFRDELTNLLPENETARLLSRQSFLLAEFLAGREPALTAAHPGHPALVQGHCHQQALVGMEPTALLLERAGITAEILEGGCCGMAGAFGFRREHAPIARAVGELHILPAVRAASPGTLIVADGFSCREQISQETGRSPLHLAEILAVPGEVASARD